MLGEYHSLISMLLMAEGNTDLLRVKEYYQQTQKIKVPVALIPLLYAASNAVQISAAFLPYYQKQFNYNQVYTQQEYTQKIYPEMLKFLLADTMRTVPEIDFKYTLSKRDLSKQKTIILYDKTCTHIPPFYGIDINAYIPKEVHSNYYWIGDISVEALKALQEKIGNALIYGLIPQDMFSQDTLTQRLTFYSETILAGCLNIQLPMLMPYFQVGLAPISYYYLLFRYRYPNIISTNALSLVHNKKPQIKMHDHVNYHYLPAHTDLDTQSDQKKNYLYLLSFG